MRSRAVFLDRDGTLIEDRGDLSSPRDVRFYRGTEEALRLLGRHFELFIVTNQNAVSKKIITMEDVERVNSFVLDSLAKRGIAIRDVFVCPHTRDEGCGCIKPKPHFANLAARKYKISLAESFSVGDHPHDAELAANFGGRGVFVLTGHGMRHRKEVKEGTPVFRDILGAAKHICRTIQRKEK